MTTQDRKSEPSRPIPTDAQLVEPRIIIPTEYLTTMGKEVREKFDTWNSPFHRTGEYVFDSGCEHVVYKYTDHSELDPNVLVYVLNSLRHEKAEREKAVGFLRILLGSLEEKEEAFYKATGKLSPHKDQSPALNGHPTMAERQKAWEDWIESFYSRAREFLARYNIEYEELPLN